MVSKVFDAATTLYPEQTDEALLQVAPPPARKHELKKLVFKKPAAKDKKNKAVKANVEPMTAPADDATDGPASCKAARPVKSVAVGKTSSKRIRMPLGLTLASSMMWRTHDLTCMHQNQLLIL